MKTIEKIEKADVLRKESNSAMSELKKVINKWGKELEKAGNPRQRSQVNRKFTELYSKADKKESKAYAKYYNFIDRNFKPTDVQKCARGGAFMGKKFIDNLKEETAPKQKRQPAPNRTANKTAKKGK